jgi:HK97 family phage major capsid protein
MKDKLLKLLKAKEERKAELGKKISETEDVKELREINAELETLNDEILELRSMIDAIEAKGKETDDNKETQEERDEDDKGVEKRTASPFGPTEILAAFGLGTGQASTEEEKRAKEKEEAEKRGKALKEKRAVTVGSSDIILPQHQASDIRPTFGEVSSLIDRVTHKPLLGGESFKQPYVKGYGKGGYTGEGQDYTEAEPVFGYAEINKAKVTAYAEDSEEILKLPAAAYDAEVQKGIRIATRKKITREILLGQGGTNELVGIFSAAATAIDPATDLPLAMIDNNTLDEIVFSFGGDEEVEDAAVLILNKKDLKAFSRLRTTDGKKFHDIKTNGNTGTIDGIPFIINSACKALTDDSTQEGDYCMAYGPLSNYMLAIFSDLEIKRSEDYKFKQGMIAHRGSVFVGGNVVSKNGFIRIKKAGQA